MDPSGLLPQVSQQETASTDSSKKDDAPPFSDKKPEEPFDLNMDQINKLFSIIGGADVENLNEIAFYDSLPNNQYLEGFLFLRPHRIRPRHERRLLSLEDLETTPERSIYTRSALLYPESFRTTIVRKAIHFIDNYATRFTASENDTEDTCMICLSNFQLNDNLRKLCCNHKYHRLCIDEWLVDTYLCPMCRANFIGLADMYSGYSFLYYSNIWSNSFNINALRVSPNVSPNGTSTGISNDVNNNINEP